MMLTIMNLITPAVGGKWVWDPTRYPASRWRVGDMMAHVQYVMRIIMAFLMMSMMFYIPRAIVSIKPCGGGPTDKPAY